MEKYLKRQLIKTIFEKAYRLGYNQGIKDDWQASMRAGIVSDYIEAWDNYIDDDFDITSIEDWKQLK